VNTARHLLAFVGLGALLLSGCGAPHGQPQKGPEVVAPDEILDFGTLYAQNCSGCHGAEGRGGAAISLADPVYLAIANDEVVRRVTANGVRVTAMPGFARHAGGMLTDKQIEIITTGVRSRWSKPGNLSAANLPSYAAKSAGDVLQGEVAYKTFCETCHGPSGRGGGKGSSITDASFLALISDQELRTLVIAGRPELGAPDWRGNVPGKTMSERDVTDVVAWLASQRTPSVSQPNADANSAQYQESNHAQ
jgi:cytochrome c oxidase cbb3-type subunit III